MNKKNKLFLGCSLFFVFLALPAQAIDMESGQYRIQFGNVSSGNSKESSSSYKMTSTLGQFAAGQFNSNGYVIKSGFEYVHTLYKFSFTVSNTTINLGELQPGTFSSGTTNLTVTYNGQGYQISTIAETPLKRISGSFIPNTTCDGSPSSCTLNTAQPWTSSNALGFGYSMTGQDIMSDFINATYFRPFPNRSASENPAVIMHNTNGGRKNRQSTMTFRANISAIQEAGTYQTVVNYIATPTY
ncbi:hypothetical protein HGA88_00310 [Candidatus Roizmanbacteria bacterium]|nr:hypothetical protein [Candidatus Roizmanbacteria bacterium]